MGKRVGYIGRVMRLFLLGGNILAALGFLFCAYSPYFSPVEHPVWACSGLFFPFFFLLNILYLFLWLMAGRWFTLLPLLTLWVGWEAVWTYCPVNKQQTSKGQTLKLLTYNVLAFSEDKDSILTYLQESKADIICLQECVFDEKVKKALSAYSYQKHMALAGESGIACFSRFPILSSERISYESVNNGSMLYRLKVGADTLILINNHLESNKLNSEDKEIYNHLLHSPNQQNVEEGGRYLLHKLADAVKIRSVQADSVSSVIARNYSPCMLVCGDFNDSPISYAHRVIGEHLQDVYAEGGRGLGISYHRDHFYFRIDHIFAGSAFRVLQCKVDRSIAASDHYPVWCILEY